MFKKFVRIALLALGLVAGVADALFLQFGGSAFMAPIPPPTATRFEMVGCNAVKDSDGMLWFDDSYQGDPYVIPENAPYVYQPKFFAYYRAECVQGYPRYVLGMADADCLNQDVRWESDGGWSCWKPGGFWTFQAGGIYFWPRGKPEGFVDPSPIIPTIPGFPTPESTQSPYQQG